MWNLWIRNFKRYIVAANIKYDTRKKALFLSLASENVVQFFDSLSSTGTLNYSDTVKQLTEHFVPCKNVLYTIFTFGKSRQRDDESFTLFYSRLRCLSENASSQRI